MKNEFNLLRKFAFFSLFLFAIFSSASFVLALNDLIALQGNVLQGGSNLALGNLTVEIWSAESGGTLVYNSTTDFNNAVVDGKYDVLLGNGSNDLNLEYGQIYFLEVFVNGENFDFNGSNRQKFQSSTGQINASFINPRTINSSHLVLNIDLSNATNVPSFNSTYDAKVTDNQSWNKSYADTLYASISSANASWNKTYADTLYLSKTGDNGTGTYNFNGGWQSNGITFSNGDIYAQTIFVYNITGLDVNTLKVNGSVIPQQGFDNTFDLGNGTLRWCNAYISNSIILNGTLNVNNSLFFNPSNSRLGIGTATPSNSLDVRGDGNFSGTVYVNNGSAVCTSENGLCNQTVGASSPFSFTSQYIYNNTAGIRVGLGTATPTEQLTLTGNFSANSTLYVTNSGTVGIGTAAPTHKLNLVGTLNVTDNVVFEKNLSLYDNQRINFGNTANGSIYWDSTTNKLVIKVS